MAEQHFIGLMSGTSLDGVDASLMAFPDSGPRMLGSVSRPFPPELHSLLRTLSTDSRLAPDWLAEAGLALSDCYAAAISELLAVSELPSAGVTAIACHGQTIRHLPSLGFSWQIGNPARLAVMTGLPVVSDFRAADMARGGQGAPLAPLFHQAFFSHPQERRLVVNLGGIANISQLIPGQAVRGWDTGPANTLLDAWFRRHYEQGLWDEGGHWAASGQIHPELLKRLLAHDYFRQAPPKSTGPELFNPEWLRDQAGALLDKLAPEDVQATLAALSCHPIVAVAKDMKADRVIVAGGGARNDHLMGTLADMMGSCPVDSSGSHGIRPEQVESAGFAWLACQRWHAQPLALASITGANSNGTAGAVWLP